MALVVVLVSFAVLLAGLFLNGILLLAFAEGRGPWMRAYREFMQSIREGEEEEQITMPGRCEQVYGSFLGVMALTFSLLYAFGTWGDVSAVAGLEPWQHGHSDEVGLFATGVLLLSLSTFTTTLSGISRHGRFDGGMDCRSGSRRSVYARFRHIVLRIGGDVSLSFAFYFCLTAPI
jgi:hypothetical protein